MWLNSAVDPLNDRIVCGAAFVSSLKSPTCALTVSIVSTPLLCDYQSSIINDIFSYPTIDTIDKDHEWYKDQGINKSNILYDLSGVNKYSLPSTFTSFIFPAGPNSNGLKSSLLHGLFKQDHVFDNASTSSSNFFFFYGECSFTSYNWNRDKHSHCHTATLHSYCAGGHTIWPQNSGATNYNIVGSDDGGYYKNQYGNSNVLGVYSSLTCPNTQAGLFDKYSGGDYIHSTPHYKESCTTFPRVPILRENPNFRTFSGNKGFFNLATEFYDILNHLLDGSLNTDEIINFHSKKTPKPYGTICSFNGSSLEINRHSFYVDHAYNGDSVSNDAWGITIDINDSHSGFNGIRCVPLCRLDARGKEYEMYVFISVLPNCTYRYVTGIAVTSLDGVHYLHIESGDVNSLPKNVVDEFKVLGNYFINKNVNNCFINVFSKFTGRFTGPVDELSVRFNNYLHNSFGEIVSFNGSSIAWKTINTFKPSIKNMSGECMYTFSDSGKNGFELHGFINGVQNFSPDSLFNKTFHCTPDKTFYHKLAINPVLLSNLRKWNRTSHFLPPASIFSNGVLYSLPDGSVSFVDSGKVGNTLLAALYKAAQMKREELIKEYGDDFQTWFSQQDKKKLFDEALTSTSFKTDDQHILLAWAKAKLGFNPVTKEVDESAMKKHAVISEKKINVSSLSSEVESHKKDDSLNGNDNIPKKENGTHGSYSKNVTINKRSTDVDHRSNREHEMRPVYLMLGITLLGGSAYLGYKTYQDYKLKQAVAHYDHDHNR